MYTLETPMKEVSGPKELQEWVASIHQAWSSIQKALLWAKVSGLCLTIGGGFDIKTILTAARTWLHVLHGWSYRRANYGQPDKPADDTGLEMEQPPPNDRVPGGKPTNPDDRDERWTPLDRACMVRSVVLGPVPKVARI
uniref:Uncharacterized protein n=1 Tax=Sphaerodactylus townsendi TaxID=933632 RepID=A0ACB8F811_9SAUR